MKKLVLVLVLFHGFNAISQNVSLEILLNNDSLIYKDFESFEFTNNRKAIYKDLMFLDTLVYDELKVYDIEIFLNDSKAFNINCSDPERPFHITDFINKNYNDYYSLSACYNWCFGIIDKKVKESNSIVINK